ncbi:MAG: hypothetical protein WA961_06315 [Rhodanobacter sp.]
MVLFHDSNMGIVGHAAGAVHALHQAGAGQGLLKRADEKLDAAIAVHHRAGRGCRRRVAAASARRVSSTYFSLPSDHLSAATA